LVAATEYSIIHCRLIGRSYVLKSYWLYWAWSFIPLFNSKWFDWTKILLLCPTFNK